jgi:hypothetical protein
MQPLPFGVKDANVGPKRVENLLGKPVTILLGEKDTAGPYTDWWPEEHLEQGAHRVARGHNYHHTAKCLAERLNVPFGWTYQIVPKVGHENKKMVTPAARLIAAHHGLEAQDSPKLKSVSKTGSE